MTHPHAKGGETFAAVRKAKAGMRKKARADKAKKLSPTGKKTRDLKTVRKSTTPASVKAAMARSIKQKAAKKASQRYDE